MSFVGELGFHLHIPKIHCVSVYNTIMEAGTSLGLKNGGFRAFNSLTLEYGFPAWGSDVRSDDSPVEANLLNLCTNPNDFEGKVAVEKQKRKGVSKKLVFLALDQREPLWGAEVVYRNGEIVGYLRRGGFGYKLNKSIGQGYIVRPDGKPVDDEFVKSGKYQVEIMGELYDAHCFLQSPFRE